MILMLLGGLVYTEATGISRLYGTVIRLITPEGTLVIEVDDPGVSIKIEGSDIVITGAGAKEIHLRPGSYTVVASKDGKLVRQELVTVTKNGKQIVRISQEAKAAKAATDAAAWEHSVSTLPALERMPLEGLTCHESLISDLSPLKGMPLKLLACEGSVSDLSPLRGMPLTDLGLARTKVSDLTPLRGMRLHFLSVSYTNVSDLSPLTGMPLQKLQCQGSKVTDLSPLKDLPLTRLDCDLRPARDAKELRAIPTLKAINGKPAAEFWRSVENK